MKLHDISKILGSSLEARMLLRFITGLSDSDLITNDLISLTKDQKIKLEEFISQRIEGRPISKILGEKEFYGRPFITSEDVLDPRPDSETLIEAVLGYAQDKNYPYRILELGTGSGCLILTLLSELPNATALATDISENALSVARQNAKRLDILERVEFIASDWFESIMGEYDIIISNPPYIETEVISLLSVDVRKYDPLIALDGGTDGLNPYKVILPQIRNYLKKGGFAAFEHGAGQGSKIKQIAERVGFLNIHTFSDLSGHDRVFSIINK